MCRPWVLGSVLIWSAVASAAATALWTLATNQLNLKRCRAALATALQIKTNASMSSYAEGPPTRV